MGLRQMSAREDEWLRSPICSLAVSGAKRRACSRAGENVGANTLTPEIAPLYSLTLTYRASLRLSIALAIVMKKTTRLAMRCPKCLRNEAAQCKNYRLYPSDQTNRRRVVDMRDVCECECHEDPTPCPTHMTTLLPRAARATILSSAMPLSLS